VVHHGDAGRRGATRAVDEREAIEVAAGEKADADVAARLAAVLIVDPVALAVGVGRAARGADGGDQTLVGATGVDHAVVDQAVVVLHLLQGDDAGGAQVGHHNARQCPELRLGGAGVEVLDVAGGDGERVGRGRLGHLAGQLARDRHQ
jgi:hypothetical protein